MTDAMPICSEPRPTWSLRLARSYEYLRYY